MSEIKPVIIKTAQERFQAYMKAKGIPISSSLVHINKMSQFEEQERKELRAALEALQAESAEQAKRIDTLTKALLKAGIDVAAILESMVDRAIAATQEHKEE